MISTGTSMFGRSPRKSVNQASTQSSVPLADACAPICQCAWYASSLTSLPLFSLALKNASQNCVR